MRFNPTAHPAANVLVREPLPKVALAAGAVLAAIAYEMVLARFEALAGRDGTSAFVELVCLLVISALLAASNIDRPWASLWLPLRILMRGTGAVVFVQILFDGLHPAALPSNLFIGILVESRIIIAIGIGSGTVAMWRPAFLLPMFLAYCAFRFRALMAFGLLETPTDFATIVDVGQFPAFVLNILWLADRAPTGTGLVEIDRLRLEKLLWAVGVGVHLGNYFHSGLAKLFAGGLDQPFFWIIHNPTQQAFAIGLFRRSMPLASWPDLLQLCSRALSLFVVPINALVLLGQLLAPFALLRRRWLIAFTILFDAMHVGVYLSLGAFFFFWIALNVIILLSLASMSDRELTPTVKATAGLCALLGFTCFATASLGWLDGEKSVRETFEANLVDGRSIPVPSAAFGLYSYNLNRGDLYIPPGHFPMRYGANVTWQSWVDGSTCGPLTVVGAQAFTPLRQLVALMLATDRFYRDHPWIKAWRLYLTYPHHQPTAPIFFEAFADTPASDIKSYSYVVESACVEMTNGRYSADIKQRSVIPIALDQ